ncbi:uncharacterized protein LOC103868630 [Brassica rapa]|uniref:uncharacterized protein LOC103868630 n=1 Tax=Brassica campestris TaxID=3711 RepID=UPI00142E6B33|nr:uncharacterized protein LOC103868630 [Brassica rapa]
MVDGICRVMQDIDLGVNDEPFVRPQAVIQQAAEENHFFLVGQPVMPRRQNLCVIIAAMPRTWGLEGNVRGRITEGRIFQFVFPSEEATETVICRGPLAYAERMLVLHRWAPLMDVDLLNYIPLWIQILGIPFQFMNREVILHIARAMNQQYIQMEYNEENGACVINNEGFAPDGNDDSEIVEEEEAADPEPEVYQIQDAYERNVAAWEAENDDEELWDGHGMQTMF